MQRGRIEAKPSQVVFGRLDRLEQRLHQLLDRRDDVARRRLVLIPERILRQRLAQALEHAVVVDDQAAVLARDRRGSRGR